MKNIFFTDESVKFKLFISEKYFFTDESVKRQITDSISENLTDSDLESTENSFYKFSGSLITNMRSDFANSKWQILYGGRKILNLVKCVWFLHLLNLNKKHILFHSLNLNQSNFLWLNRWFAFSMKQQWKQYFPLLNQLIFTV